MPPHIEEVNVVTEFLKQAPNWTAMRCTPLFWAAQAGELVLDAVMSPAQPDNADWPAEPGTPFAVVITVPSEGWLALARASLDRWVADGREVELRRTRAWEDGGQVLVWSPEASLLVTLAG